MATRRAVATVTLVGLAPGEPVWVNTDDPQIDRWLRGGQLRLVDDKPKAKVKAPPAAAQAEPQAEVEGEPQPEVETPKPRRAAPRRVTK